MAIELRPVDEEFRPTAIDRIASPGIAAERDRIGADALHGPLLLTRT
jgi:hypothetical protein